MASVHVITRKIIILLYHVLIIVVLANAQTNVNVESDALLRLKVSFNNAGVLQSWQPGTSPCTAIQPWEGIRCEGGAVQGIRLEGLNLSGLLDIDALLQLPMLRTLSLMSNSFSGNIPAFNKLVQLKALYLSNNQFAGEIPPDYFVEMKNLKKLWLSWNNFSGPIPSSLDLIPLVELYLEHNHFSGSIPPLDQEALAELNMSNNNLTGPIQPTLSRFDAKTFEGNPGLCGPQVGKPCTGQPENTPPPITENKNDPNAGIPNAGNPNAANSKAISVWIMLASVAILLIMIIAILFLRSKQIQKQASQNNVNGFNATNKSRAPMPAQKNRNESGKVMAEPAILVGANSKGSSSSSGSRSSARAGARGTAGGPGDLTMVNDEKGEFGLADLMKATAEVLGNGTTGSSYKARLSNGFTVVVKRIKELERHKKDAFDAEIRRLASINHKNVLAPIAYHYRKEEKLVITEYMAKGSLLYVLHGDKGAPNKELKWPVRLKIIQGIARGLFHIHTELAQMELPHGNLKSSNVLLSPEFEPKLSDYGFNSLAASGQAKQALFAYKSPEALKNQPVSTKSDVYCMGIVILELLTGKYPSQYLGLKSGTDVVQWARSSIDEGREVDILDPQIGSSVSSLPEMKQALRIGVACTESEPEERLDMREAIRRIEALHCTGENSREGTSFQIS